MNTLLPLLLLTWVQAVLSVVHPDGVSKVTHYQDELGNYKFGYTVSSIDGEHFHRSDKDAEGRIVGSYGLTGPDGRQRVVDYVADHTGFKARIRSNEPGLASAQSSDVTIEKFAGPAEIIGNPAPLDFAASNAAPAGEHPSSAGSLVAVENAPVGSERKAVARPDYAERESTDNAETGNSRLDYAESDSSSRKLANYGERLKETTSGVVYARPLEEQQYRRLLPINPSDEDEDRSRTEDTPWTSRFTSNNRRRLTQRQNSDSYGTSVELEDTLGGGGYRPPLDPFRGVRRPLVTSRATSIARPLQIFTPQPSTPPYGGFERKDPFSFSTDDTPFNRYPFSRDGSNNADDTPFNRYPFTRDGSGNTDGTYPGISLYNIHGGLGNMFPLLPPPLSSPGIARDPMIGLSNPELILRELMALEGQRVPGHPELVFRVISAQNGIQVVPVDPLTGQAQNVPLIPLYGSQNGERRAILDRNYDFKFGEFDGSGLRRPGIRVFDREPGSAEGSTRDPYDSNNVNRAFPGNFPRRPSLLNPRPGDSTDSQTNFDDDDFPVRSRYVPGAPLPRINTKGTRYDPSILRRPVDEPSLINSRGYRSVEDGRITDSTSASDARESNADEDGNASKSTTSAA